MVHTLKLQARFMRDVLFGVKTFEVRQEDDRTFSVGDLVRLLVVSDDGSVYLPEGTREAAVQQVLEKSLFRIIYVLHGWGLRDGWCAFGIGEVE